MAEKRFLQNVAARARPVPWAARQQAAGPVRPSLVIDPTHALVAQLDRASDFESEGREFESLRARQAKSMAYWLSRIKMLPMNLPLGSGWEGAARFSFRG